MELIPSTREGATRLGFVTIDQMTSALVNAVETEPDAARIFDVPRIRQAVH